MISQTKDVLRVLPDRIGMKGNVTRFGYWRNIFGCLTLVCFITACGIPVSGYDPINSEVRVGGTTILFLGVTQPPVATSIEADSDNINVIEKTPSVSDISVTIQSLSGGASAPSYDLKVRSVFSLDADPLSLRGVKTGAEGASGHRYISGVFAVVDIVIDDGADTLPSIDLGPARLTILDASREIQGAPFVSEQIINILDQQTTPNLFRHYIDSGYATTTTPGGPDISQLEAEPNIRIVTEKNNAANSDILGAASFKLVYPSSLFPNDLSDPNIKDLNVLVTKTVSDPNLHLSWNKNELANEVELVILVKNPHGFHNCCDAKFSDENAMSSIAIVLPNYDQPSNPFNGNNFSYAYYDLNGVEVANSDQGSPDFSASMVRLN